MVKKTMMCRQCRRPVERPRVRWQLTKKDDYRIRLSCDACGAYIKWGATAEYGRLAGPQPPPPPKQMFLWEGGGHGV